MELWLIRKFADGDGDVTRSGDSIVEGIYGRPFLFNWFLSRFSGAVLAGDWYSDQHRL